MVYNGFRVLGDLICMECGVESMFVLDFRKKYCIFYGYLLY